MNLIKLLLFIILLWSCGNSETAQQNQSIIKESKVEIDSTKKLEKEQRYNELLELAIDQDSIKVNGKRAFRLPKNYLIKMFGKPDSTSNNFAELNGYGTYETLYWGKTSYTAYLFDIADFEKEIKKSPNQYHWEVIDLSEGHNVEINGFLIDRNTNEESIAKQFPKEYKKAISEKKTVNYRTKTNSNVYFVSLYTKSKNTLYEDTIGIKIEGNKVTQIIYAEFID
jgi:hypothetical protein